MSCFEMRCRECPDHIIASDGKVICNKENRLGLRKVSIIDMLTGDDKKND